MANFSLGFVLGAFFLLITSLHFSERHTDMAACAESQNVNQQTATGIASYKVTMNDNHWEVECIKPSAK